MSTYNRFARQLYEYLPRDVANIVIDFSEPIYNAIATLVEHNQDVAQIGDIGYGLFGRHDQYLVIAGSITEFHLIAHSYVAGVLRLEPQNSSRLRAAKSIAIDWAWSKNAEYEDILRIRVSCLLD